MKFYLGVTDNSWFNYLSQIYPDDINFWQPGGNTAFKVLNPGEPFLFKLKSPLNAIGGIGFFSRHTYLPISVAWEIFGERNGCNSFEEFRRMILNYRQDKDNFNPQIGCIVLSNPVFFRKEDWIKVPDNWSKSIVQGKSYDMQDPISSYVWQQVQTTLEKYPFMSQVPEKTNQLILEESEPRYGKPVLSKVRIGQGAFRVMVTDSYSRRCAISGEKTLPVLEAAHIKPYALSGPHTISNGILLRSDMHKLFDTGYITITNDLKVEISKRIKEEYENGREYYQYHGKQLLYLPTIDRDKPSNQFIDWHNSNVFRS
jgi:putative restriction endonuclease